MIDILNRISRQTQRRACLALIVLSLAGFYVAARYDSSYECRAWTHAAHLDPGICE